MYKVGKHETEKVNNSSLKMPFLCYFKGSGRECISVRILEYKKYRYISTGHMTLLKKDSKKTNQKGAQIF